MGILNLGKFKLAAALFGIGFLAVGIAGYIPLFASSGNLFGLFAIDSLHNILYIITGILGIYTFYNQGHAKLYFRVVGIIYAILALAGFLHLGGGFTATANLADNLAYLVLGLIALYLGFRYKE